MRLFLLLILLCGLSPAPVPAQSITDNLPDSASVPAPDVAAAPAADAYTISDVAVDVTADSANHARDQALLQAERAAFAQLGAKANASDAAAKLDDDSIAALVQSYEVQSEKLSKQRYIGSFTIHFKPAATRKKLAKYISVSTDMPSNTGDTPKVMPTGPLSHFTITVQAGSLPALTGIKKRLNAVPAVASIDVRDVGRSASHIDLSYTGAINDLQQALTAQGLVLRQMPGGEWQLYDGSITPREGAHE